MLNNLNENEMKAFNSIKKRYSSKARSLFIKLCWLFLALLILFIIIGTICRLWSIQWKELWWLAFIAVAFVLGLKAISDVENDIRYLLKIFER